MTNMILNSHSSAPCLYTIGTNGRGLNCNGRTYQIYAWDLRQAIRETRKVVSPAWSLRLVKKERV